MTLQVAFVARDGLVIASDKKAISSGEGFRAIPRAGTRNIRRSSRMQKILVAENGSLICAFSGNDLSAAIAQRLVDSPPDQFDHDTEVRNHLLKSGQFAKELAKSPENQLIIAAVPNALQGVHRLWRVYFYPDPLVCPVEDMICGGDESNPAIFLMERYYEPSHSVQDLQFLAAHVVIEGHNLNALSVDGLDVLISEGSSKPRFLTDDELEPLRKRSATLHSDFKKSIFPND